MIKYSDLTNSLQMANNQDSMHQGSMDDPIQRAAKHLRSIINDNDQLQKSIYQLQNNPKLFINPIKNQMLMKIQQLRNQNQKLRKMVKISKLPTYTQMKRKSIAPNQNKNRQSMRNSLNQSFRNSMTIKSALSQVNSNHNFDKHQSASTCFNQKQRYQTVAVINPILKLQKPSQSQEQQKQRLTQQIHYLIAKTQIFQEAMERMEIEQLKQCQIQDNNRNYEQSQISKIQDYKKKLLRLLNKLKSRQVQMDQLVKIYKQLHQETIRKLQSSSEALRQLQQKNIDQNIQKKYAQVLELQERLKIINSQIEQRDEEKWLQKALKQLTIVCKRLNIPLPKSESPKQAIDQLCQILIQNHLMTKNDIQDRIGLIKEYHEQQRQNNQRLVQALKNKQLALSKKLNVLQMQKESTTKK